MMDRAKDWFFDKLACFVAAHRPERLNQLIRKEVERIAQDVSVRSAMQYLDREGLLHCAMCAQRFGLQRAKLQDQAAGRSREVYLCMPHYSQSKAAHTGGLVNV